MKDKITVKDLLIALSFLAILTFLALTDLSGIMSRTERVFWVVLSTLCVLFALIRFWDDARKLCL